jgi:2-C-methyl-D-erythritol 4-phosphate cytidylyltransferase
MGAAVPKQYLPLAGSSVIEQTLLTLLGYPRIHRAVVVISVNDTWWPNIGFDSGKLQMVSQGGEERCHSVLNGLTALKTWAQPNDWVLVHDAVRPCLRTEDLDTLLDSLWDDPIGGLLATPVRDTVKRADGRGRVATSVDRTGLWHALTPQMFRLGTLTAALQGALERHSIVTDEASAIEAMGLAPRLIEGHADNIKITQPEDLDLAELYLRRRHA